MKKETYRLEMTRDQLLALRDVVGPIDNHSSWIVGAIENTDLLPSIYQKVYDLSNPVIEEKYGVTIKSYKERKD